LGHAGLHQRNYPTNRWGGRIGILLALATLSATARCFDQPSDRTFREPNGFIGFFCSYGLVPACPGGGQFDVGVIPISRVAGPGLFDAPGNHYNPDGSIQPLALETFLLNSVVGRKAYVSVIAYNDDDRKHTFTFAMNRRVIGTIEVPAASPQLSPEQRYVRTCLAIDTAMVRFARRIPGADPTPGLNEITVSGDSQLPRVENEIVTLGAYVDSITIEAMAPVVLVHGIRSNASIFDQFEPVLAAGGLPTARVNLGEGSIQSVGSVRLRQWVESIASEFGSKRLHVVAHSKGGLWTRWMMQTLSELAIYSLTTLDTPHEGSVLADLYLVARRYRALQPLLAWLPAQSIADLDVASLERLNREMPLLVEMRADGRATKVEYYAHAGDANLNGNVDQRGFGVIEPTEATYTLVDRRLYRKVQEYRRATLRRLPSGETTLAQPLIPNAPPYPLNDFIVTTGSAWCLNTSACSAMTKLPFVSAPWKKHHGSIVDGHIAEFVKNFLGVDLERRLSN